MVRLLTLAVVLGGCGRLRFDPPSDAAIDAVLDAGETNTAYRAAVLADGPIAYWRLGELTPPAARDELGPFHGTYEPGCTLGVPGALFGDGDRAVRFNGLDCFVRLPPDFGFVASAPFSVEAWVSPAAIGSFHHVFTNQLRADTGPPDDGYALVVSAAGIYAERVVGATIVGTNPDTVTLNTFVHAVATYDGTSLRFYVNGLIAAPAEADARPLPTLNVPAYIGAAGPTTNLFDGAIDEVAIYPTALSPARIAAHYSLGIRGF